MENSLGQEREDPRRWNPRCFGISADLAKIACGRAGFAVVGGEGELRRRDGLDEDFPGHRHLSPSSGKGSDPQPVLGQAARFEAV